VPYIAGEIATAGDLGIHAINRFSLRNTVSGDCPQVFDPAEDIRSLEPVIVGSRLIGDTGSDWPAKIVDENDERNNVRARRQPNHASRCPQGDE
jgi:hypothetical protein